MLNLSRPPARRRLLAVLASITGLVLAMTTVWGIWAYQVLWHPGVDQARPADAVVVLGPITEGGSLEAGLALVEQGMAPNLLLSVLPGQRGRGRRLCADPGSGTGPAASAAAAAGATTQTGTAAVICFVPTPLTTRGEARAIADLAARRNWHSVIVVTPAFHASRSRMVFQRCFTGTLDVVTPQVPATTRVQVFQTVYQSAAYLKAALQQGC